MVLLLHVSHDFRVDVNKTGHLDIEKLGEWAKRVGMPNVTYNHLRAMILQVDTNKTGTVEFWEFFGIQVI